MSSRALNPTGRFSDRVDAYARHRPGYPKALLEFLRGHLGLAKGVTVADIGSGTGVFSAFLLETGCRVIGVEPNREMRERAEEILEGEPRFGSVNGTAEATGLGDASVDHLVAAQAFHWFEPEPARREFARILKPGGLAVLAWNDRRIEGDAFSREYEALINRFATDYERVNHRNLGEDRIRAFLGGRDYGSRSFENAQDLDFDGLLGRLASSSYMPNVGHPRYSEMARELRALFDGHQESGHVRIEYDARVYFARMGAP